MAPKKGKKSPKSLKRGKALKPTKPLETFLKLDGVKGESNTD
jgi:hypothetical protein